MTGIEIDAALAAANPLAQRRALGLGLERAEMELIEEIVSVPVSTHRRVRPLVTSRRGRHLARARLAVLALIVVGAVAVAAAIVLW